MEYLASGSADTTVRIWDLEELVCKATFANLHKNKVQLVRWNPIQESLLLTGGYDRLLNLVDVRERPLGEKATKFRLKKELKDLETGSWHPTMEHNFVISTESGIVVGYDIRKPDAPIFEFQAHEKACSNLSFSPHIPNMMATCSTDEYVKVWDIAHAGQPKLVSYKKMAMGELFSLAFYKDIPWVLAAGGSKGEIAVWDTEENETIAKHFEPTLDKTTFEHVEISESEEEEKSSDEEAADKMEEGEVKIEKKKKSKKVERVDKPKSDKPKSVSKKFKDEKMAKANQIS